MIECVVRMEMPQGCNDCPFRDILFCCCVKDRKYAGSSPVRPNWCQIIRQLPEGHGRLGDLDKLEGVVNMARIRAMQNGEDTNPYWECADLILQAPTIVPAERSET